MSVSESSLYTSPSPRMIDMLKNARVPFELNAKPSDTVAIITDTGMDPNVWKAVAAASNTHGCETTIMMMKVREHHGIVPPESVLTALRNADISIALTSQELHTGGFYHLSLTSGHKYIIMEQVNADTLAGGACDPETHRLMNEHGPKLQERLNGGGVWHITSEYGTDHTVNVVPRTGRFFGAGYCRPSTVPGQKWFLTSFPGGECGASPIRETGNGPIVIDTSIHYPAGLLREPIRLLVEKGRIVDIQGGTEARQLREYIKKFGDDNTYNCPIELSIGFNPKCPITGVLRTDKKHYGKIHIGLGSWGEAKSKLHIDGVIEKPTITINKEALIDEGRIEVSPFDKWI